ncbi:MAG: lipid-binding SYLF domain-containing protein [Synergistaceae bacterium]|jgi:lipid-binding SYLF domain-containing protein|nr:lipid-binding SYLF domain-containing protein [Synergistaceae bacterium]
MKRSLRGKALKFTVAVLVFCLTMSAAAALAAEAQHEKHIRLAAELIKKMSAQDDVKTMAQTAKSGKAIAIFPNLIQAGLGIGGMHGEGVVLVKNSKGGWNGPSFASLVGGSFGLQIGIKEVGLVLVITNQEGLQAFTGGKSFKLGGDVSVAAGPVGRDAQAATDSRLDASIYSYSMSKGLFAGMALSGSTINVNGDANKAYWGKATEAKTALSKQASGAKINPLTKELNSLMKLAGK